MVINRHHEHKQPTADYRGKRTPYNPPKTKERDRKYKNKRLLRKKKPSSEGGKL